MAFKTEYQCQKGMSRWLGTTSILLRLPISVMSQTAGAQGAGGSSPSSFQSKTRDPSIVSDSSAVLLWHACRLQPDQWM